MDASTRHGKLGIMASHGPVRGRRLSWVVVLVLAVSLTGVPWATRGAEAPPNKPPPPPPPPAAPPEAPPSPPTNAISSKALQNLFEEVARQNWNGPRQEEDTNELTRLPPALLSHDQKLQSSNLTHHPHEGIRDGMNAEFQLQFELGVKQRKNRLYNLARNTFSYLLKLNGPSERLKKASLLELALIAELEKRFDRAIQIYAQYIKTYKDDMTVPEIYLRQGLMYRNLGATTLALSKFYAVMSSAINLKQGRLDYYKSLVLQAQTEIADTYYLDGQFEPAADFLSRLLKQESSGLNRSRIAYKLIRCLNALGNHAESVTVAEDFLAHHQGSPVEPEVRFLLANALKALGEKGAALRQVMEILQSQKALASSNPTNWIYWQQRTGNQIANQLYQEGDYLNALRVYTTLAGLSQSPHWQLPILYQIGLVYEKLEQPDKAIAHYAQIQEMQKELASQAGPGLQLVLDMARWRREFLDWQIQINQVKPVGTNAQNQATGPGTRTP